MSVRALLRLAALCGLVSLASPTHACTVSGSPGIDLGSKTSFDVRVGESNAGSGESGLTCPGVLGLLSSQYIYASLISKSNGLIHSSTGDSIPFEVSTTPGGAPLVVGQMTDNLAASGLLTLSGPSGTVALFVHLGAAGNVAAGTYTGTITLGWHYATCTNLSALNICVGSWTVSPGITQNCAPILDLCTLITGSLPGSGLPVTINISLTVTRDCRFDSEDIDFGGAPFVESFEPVSGTLRITCTKGSTYTVGLSNGGFYAGGRRQMASGANRLQYDIFRPGGSVWNDTTQRVSQDTPASGDAPETFTYEARIYTDQDTPPPGTYTDSVIVDVQF